MVAVSVNDRPLEVSAIVERGRVLLPMRATFDALGASISYEANGRIVIAHTLNHSLRLPIGERSAQIDGQPVTLEVPARVLANRIYVPLRLVAQSMGAIVGYDARAQLVTVISQNAAGGVNVIALDPPDGAALSSAYPTISASLGSARAAHGDVSLRIDGEDVTPLASFDGSTITYMPRTGLTRGSHNVIFAGRTLQGGVFSARWSFATTLNAPPDAGPGMYSTYDYRFYMNGTNAFYPGDWMHFVLIAPPGGSAVLQLCDLGYQYPFWSGGSGAAYEANVLAPYGYWIPACQVTAIYTTWTGQRMYVPLPLTIGLYTNPNVAPKSPRPVATTRPLPRSPRKPEPTPAPLPVHTPQAQPSLPPPPRPVATFHPIHIPLPPRPHSTP